LICPEGLENESTMTTLSRSTTVAFWLLMLVAQVLAFLLFKDLADLSQWWFQSSREFTMSIWYNRWTISGVSLLALALSVVLWLRNPTVLGRGLMFVLVAIGLFNCYVGILNPGLMFRAQQGADEAKFVSVAEAPGYLEQMLYASYAEEPFSSVDEISVIVLETDQGARAYTDYYMLQPHVANAGTIDGEEVVMTYCGLTNMGIAYSPSINGEPVQLRAITQLRNNLVMADAFTGEPIQQFWGSMERDGEFGPAMREWPSLRMPFGSFRELFPDGLVYVNGIEQQSDNILVQLFDRIIRDGVMVHAVRTLQWLSNEPAFPTITEFDERLPRKELVWGISVGQDHVAYTKEFVAQQPGGLVNVSIGGKALVVRYDSEFDAVVAFYNPGAKPVRDVDLFGNTDQGKLERVETLKSGIFWFIWYDFHKDTDVNRQ
jgi:Protein of unknown function (DUF3179)